MDKSQRFFGSYLAFFAGLVALLLAIRTYESNLTPPPPTLVTAQPSPSSTQTKYILSSTPAITSTRAIVKTTSTPVPTVLLSTFTPFPSPVKNAAGINLPVDFSVDVWHDNYIRCDPEKRYSVIIYGVEISNGTPPYIFKFWQFENSAIPIIKSITLLTSNREYLEFDPPVVVAKGRYVHVVLTFIQDGTEVTWIDDLYYPFLDPRCP